MIHLLTHEKQALANFLKQSKEEQALTIIEAKRNPKVSGALINAYRLINSNIA